MHKVNSASDISEFKKRYEEISGLEIPESFLIDSKIYAFQKDNEIVGGFILSSKRPLRTLSLFTKNEKLRSNINSKSKSSIVEICCFWIDRRHRKNKLFTILVWLKMALTVSQQKEKIVLYGTNSKGLAKMYGYPKGSILISQELLKQNNNYIFLAKRRRFLNGVIRIIIAKVRPKMITPKIINHKILEKSIYHELSI